MAEIDYAKATDEVIQAEMIVKYKAEKLAEIESGKMTTFQEAKEAEVKKLRIKFDEKVIAFGKAAQIAEDADYDVTQIPDGDTY